MNPTIRAQLRTLLEAIEREYPDVLAVLRPRESTERTLEAIDDLDVAGALLEIAHLDALDVAARRLTSGERL